MSFVTLPIIRGFDKLYPAWSLWNRKAQFAGGFPRWMASPLIDPVEAGDIDVFPNNEQAFKEIIEDCRSAGCTPVSDTFTAVTMSDPLYGRLKGSPKLQIIKPVNQGAIVARGNLWEILSNFDFTVVRVGILSDSQVMADAQFLEDESNKKLRIKNIHCPISSTLRFMKYAKKGYSARANDVLPLFIDWEKRDDAYKNTIKENLPKLAVPLTDANALTDEVREKLTMVLYID